MPRWLVIIGLTLMVVELMFVAVAVYAWITIAVYGAS